MGDVVSVLRRIARLLQRRLPVRGRETVEEVSLRRVRVAQVPGKPPVVDELEPRAPRRDEAPHPTGRLRIATGRIDQSEQISGRSTLGAIGHTNVVAEGTRRWPGRAAQATTRVNSGGTDSAAGNAASGAPDAGSRHGSLDVRGAGIVRSVAISLPREMGLAFQLVDVGDLAFWRANTATCSHPDIGVLPQFTRQPVQISSDAYDALRNTQHVIRCRPADPLLPMQGN